MSESSDQPTRPHEPSAAASQTDQAPGGQPLAPRSDAPAARTSGLDLQRVAIGAVAALLVLVVAGLAFGASRLPLLEAAAEREQRVDHGRRDVRGFGPQDLRGGSKRDVRGPAARRPGPRGDIRAAPDHRSFALREITISAIAGSELTLTTEDGWTRTISVTDATTMTRAGAAITLADLKLRDRIRFRQERNDDGSFTMTAIAVILPHVAGEVTAATGDTSTIERRDGSMATIHVGSGTTYHVRGIADATLSDVSVGMLIVAAGTQNADGSLEAVAVSAATRH